MSAAADYRALLVSRPALTALVGDRVALNAVPQGSAPPVVVFVVSGNPEYTLDNTAIPYVATIETQCWAETGAAAQAVADQVAAALVSESPRRGWVVARSSGYDSETDLHAEILNVEWWVDP